MCITYIKALKVIWHHQFVLGMRGLWNIKADCRFIHTQGETAEIVIHTQGESWDCSYSWSESWDYKSQPFKDRVFQPDDVLSLFRHKGKLAQWIENDKNVSQRHDRTWKWHLKTYLCPSPHCEWMTVEAEFPNGWRGPLPSYLFYIKLPMPPTSQCVQQTLPFFSKNRNSQSQGLNPHCRLWNFIKFLNN